MLDADGDADKASLHLSNAAGKTYATAMGGMAELLLRPRRGREAIVWTQLHVHHQNALSGTPASAGTGRRAHAASLVKRSLYRLRVNKGLSGRAGAGRAGFIADHDETIRNGIARRARGVSELVDQSGPMHLNVQPGEHHSTRSRMRSPGRAHHLIGVDADGRVERHHVVGGLPDEHFAVAMARFVRRLRHNAVDADRPGTLRWAIAPLAFDDHSVSLRRRQRPDRPSADPPLCGHQR